MFRGFATRCLKTGNVRLNRRHGLSFNRRTYSERRRRSGDGRKRDIFEERSAASQEEYFRLETARQLKELREKLLRQKKEQQEHETITQKIIKDSDNGGVGNDDGFKGDTKSD